MRVFDILQLPGSSGGMCRLVILNTRDEMPLEVFFSERMEGLTLTRNSLLKVEKSFSASIDAVSSCYHSRLRTLISIQFLIISPQPLAELHFAECVSELRDDVVEDVPNNSGLSFSPLIVLSSCQCIHRPSVAVYDDPGMVVSELNVDNVETGVAVFSVGMLSPHPLDASLNLLNVLG